MPVMRDAVVGRPEPVEVAACNLVTGNPMLPPFPVELDVAVFGTGCFWGTEEYFWQIDGVWTTAVGYAGGTLAHPRYEEVCTGRTGHAEVVLVVFDPQRVTYDDLLRVFWETHDPTQGMRQGNDIGTQYRSVILTTDEPQALQAARSSDVFERALATAGFGSITTEIKPLEDAFFYAEDHHQQYLAKNPHGYRCHVALGVSYPGG